MKLNVDKLRLQLLIVKLSPILLVPWIILSINPMVLYLQQIPLIVTLTLVGITGSFFNKKRLTSALFLLLLLAFIWGKAGTDLFHLPAPDTAFFMLQFVTLLFLYELNNVRFTFESDYDQLGQRNDVETQQVGKQIISWYNQQFVDIGKITVAAILVSLGLIILGGLASVRISGLVSAGLFVIGSVIVLLLLLTYNREPSHVTTATYPK